MTVDIRFVHHQDKKEPSCLVDGAYCLHGYNGNVFLAFFQENPTIPEEITIDQPDCPPHISASPEILSNRTEGEVERIIVGKIQISRDNARKLIDHLNSVLQG